MRLKVFGFFVALYAVTTAGHIYTIDSYLNYAVTRSIGTQASLEIPRFMMTVEGVGGHHYSKLGIGQSLVSLIPYWIGALVERFSPANPAFRAYSHRFTIPHNSGAIHAEPQTLIRISDQDGARVCFTTLTNVFIAGAVCLIFWLLLRDLGLSSRGALWGTVLLGFSTPLWVYSRDLFAEPLFAACLLGTFYLLTSGAGEGRGGRMLVAGLISSLGILARVSFVPIALIFAVHILLASKDRTETRGLLLRYCVGCLPGVLVVGLLNLHKFGSPFLSGYHTAFDKGFAIPLGQGLTWILFSPYRSLFLYAPAVVLFGFGLAGYAKRYRGRFWLMISVIVYTFLVYSKWWAWHGGWCWGPRFLLPIIPLLLLPGLVAVKEGGKRLLGVAIGLGVLGFCVQLGGVLINYTAAYDYWIKIGKLDWSEAEIHRLFPIWVHTKALLATDPVHYDLWIIQALQTGSKAWLGLVAGGGALIAYAVRGIRRRGRPGKHSMSSRRTQVE